MATPKFKFGDVIYRPCISYAGHKNFVLPTVVKNVEATPYGDCVRSYDANRQGWTDYIKDEGVTFFITKEAAEVELEKLIKRKEQK